MSAPLRNPRARIIVGVLVALAGAALLAWALRVKPPWFERHVLTEYCFRSPSDWELMAGIRKVVAVCGAILLLVVAPLLARWAGRVTARSLLHTMLMVVAVILATATTSELRLRRRAEHLEKEVAWWANNIPKMTRDDPRFGWRFQPSTELERTALTRKFTYYINSEGNRARSMTSLPDPSLPTILVMGESVGVGHALEYEDTFAGLLEKDLKIQVVNLSVHGWSPDQQYLRLMDELPRFSHPVAVVITFLPTSIARMRLPKVINRVRLIERPHLVLGKNGQLEMVPASSGLELSKLWRDEPYHSDEALETSRVVLRETVAAIRARGARPLFVVTNFGGACQPDEGQTIPWIIDELLEREHLPYVNAPIGNGETINDDDRHPNAIGARKIADAIEKALGEASQRP